MSLTLEQKQVIRSIADLVVRNPELAGHIVSVSKHEGIPEPVQNIIVFAAENHTNLSYKTLLAKEIGYIKDREVNTIFSSSLNYHGEEAERLSKYENISEYSLDKVHQSLTKYKNGDSVFVNSEDAERIMSEFKTLTQEDSLRYKQSCDEVLLPRGKGDSTPVEMRDGSSLAFLKELRFLTPEGVLLRRKQKHKDSEDMRSILKQNSKHLLSEDTRLGEDALVGEKKPTILYKGHHNE